MRLDRHGCISLKIREWGGGRLRIILRKVKDLVNINFDHIFTKIMQFFAKFPLKYAIFSYFLFTIFDFCNFSSFFANFSHFFLKIS